MIRVSHVLNELCTLAPLELQMSFDNSGFLFGRREQEIHRVLLALDVTKAVIEEAVDWGAELIVSHHPLIFSPIRSVTDEKLLTLAEHGIAVISMHTNLDIAEGGVNDVLLRLLGAEPQQALNPEGCGRIGDLPAATTLADFLPLCKQKLGCRGIRYYDSGKPIRRLAVMGGSGGDALEDAAEKGCDCYVTADVKYHQFLRAMELGIHLLDADHFYTENPMIPVLCEKLEASFPALSFRVSKCHDAPISFF